MEIVDIQMVPRPSQPVQIVQPVQPVQILQPSNVVVLKKLPEDKSLKRANEVKSDIHSFRRHGVKETKVHWCKTNCCKWKWLSCFSLVPNWLWYTALGLTAFAAMSFFISTMVVYFYSVQSTIRPIFSTNTAPGGSCSSTSQCVTNAYCVKSSGSNTGSCQCATNYYYVSGNSCTARLAYGSGCTTSSQCITSAGLTCISSTCGCDSTIYFYNTTSLRCQYLKTVNQYCTANSDCGTTNSGCVNNQCQCNTNYYFDTLTGSCFARSVQSQACSGATQCINWAYCGLNSGDTYAKCYCDPLLYYYETASSTCQVRLTISQSCADQDACDLYTQNLRCFSGVCGCDPKLESWNQNFTKCLSLYRYSKTCSLIAPYYNCITSSPTNLQCSNPDYGGIRTVCRCSSGRYYDVLTPGCVGTKAYNATCGTRAECNSVSQCVAYGSGSVTKRCTCIPNYSYYDTGTGNCRAKFIWGTGCSYSTQCKDYANMICTGGSCDCDPSIMFYNTSTSSCQWLARTDDFCVASIQCASGSCNWFSSTYTNPYCN